MQDLGLPGAHSNCSGRVPGMRGEGVSVYSGGPTAGRATDLPVAPIGIGRVRDGEVAAPRGRRQDDVVCARTGGVKSCMRTGGASPERVLNDDPTGMRGVTHFLGRCRNQRVWPRCRC